MKKEKEINEEEKKNKKGKRAKENTSKKIRNIIIVLVVFIIIAVLGVWFGYRIHANGGGLEGTIVTMLGTEDKTKENLEPLTVLVVGKSQNLTDTLMVCKYDPQTQDAVILSIPRDTFIGKNKNRATAWDKINSLYQQDPMETVEAINDITGLNIQYYLTVDTKALRELVDAIGGVYFDVPIEMDYDDPEQGLYIHLDPGYQLLNGNEAEQVVRFRHNNDGTTYPEEYGAEDIGRMKTQRAFITSVVKQTLTAKNIWKVNTIMDIAQENVETNLNYDTIKNYIPYAVSINMEGMQTASLPGEPEKCNGVWVYIHDKEETRTLVDELFLGIEPEVEDANTITNELENIAG